MVVLIGWSKSPGAYTGISLKNGKPIPGFAPAIDCATTARRLLA